MATADDSLLAYSVLAVPQVILLVSKVVRLLDCFDLDSAANYSMRRLAKTLGMRSAIDPDDATQVIHSLEL